ncbi:MAG: hypothetical protein R3249_08775 [Nitriliruptorales bacterium]|nr:hypothetical protein [Nitriliruptorales bacterium]
MGLTVVGVLASFGSILRALIVGFEANDLWALPTPVFVVAGAMVTLGRPRHPIGWLLLLGGFGMSTGLFLIQAGPDLGDGVGPWAEAVGAALNSGSVLVIPAVLLLFPDGRLPSKRWRPVMGLVGAAATIGTAAALMTGGWGGDVEDVENAVSPLYESLGPVGEALSGVFLMMMSLVMVAAGIELMLRFRRSSGVERQQMKFLALAATLLVATLGLQFAIGSGATAATDVPETLVIAGAFAAVPLAVAAAVLRYRLWDIDLIINRAMVYSVMLVALGALYALVVVLVSLLLPRGGDLPVAASTLAVAGAFAPVRRRAQDWVDRMFHRSRYDVSRLVEEFSERLRDGMEPEAVERELHAVVDHAVKPATISTWTRRVRRVASGLPGSLVS